MLRSSIRTLDSKSSYRNLSFQPKFRQNINLILCGPGKRVSKVILTPTQIYQPLEGEALSFSTRSAYCHCQEHDVSTFKVGTSLLRGMFSLGPKHDRGLENIPTGCLISKRIGTTAKIKIGKIRLHQN